MTMTALDAARTLAAPVNDIGGRFMLHPDTLGPGKDAGYPNGFAYYMAGRGGVLGDVDAEVIVSAFGFFAPGVVRAMWEAGVAVEGARAAGTRYARAAAEFGRQRLGGFSGAARLAELAQVVVERTDSTGLALFAGWKVEPLPDDAPGRAYQLLHVLRELRGSQHIVGVVAAGLAPRDAVLVGPGGADQAKMFGWTEPFPPLGPATVLRTRAEEITDQLSASSMEHLDGNDRSELVSLVIACREHLDAA